MSIFTTACPRNCYSSCSFKVHVENNKVVNIEPHPENKATPEGVCLKGLSYVERANSSQRILYPYLRNQKENKFFRISWEKALEIISEKLLFYRSQFGAQSVMYYTASGMQGILNGYGKRFWKLFGGATTHYGSLCWSAGLEATRLTLGECKHNAPWITAEAKLIVILGKNVAESNVQEMIQIEKAQLNGAKLVVIDTRRTQTSERADLLIQPRPGTDAALALAVANILIKRGLHDVQFIENHVFGFEKFKEFAENFTAEKASKICQIPEKYILRLADLMGNIKPMTLIMGLGVQRFSNGGQTTRCILALSAITGNIGKRGAGWQYGNLQCNIFDDVKEPITYYPSESYDKPFRRSISVAKMGEDILAASNPELKMIWVERANPITSNPDTNTMLKAFKKLEFKVVVDQFLTDTANEADLILPAKNMFEQSDLVVSYWNPYVQLRQKVVEPAGEVKPETEIYHLLAKKLNFSSHDIERDLPLLNDEKVEAVLSEALKPFPELTLNELKERPLIPNLHQEIAFSDFVFPTPSGKIELYSSEAQSFWGVSELPSFDELNELPNDEFPLFLLTPNSKNRIHSQFNNLNLIKQLSPHPILFIHPNDAQKRKIQNGNLVKVFNQRGEFQLIAQYNYSIKTGCVAITNGWWLSQGGSVNLLSKGRQTDMGLGTAFHDCAVEVKLA